MNTKSKFRVLIALLVIIVSIPFLYGCGKKAQPQKKPADNGGGQEIKIAVSFADIERDGNQIIKNIMSARQEGKQTQQSGQQNAQQNGQSQQAGLDVVSVQTGQNGGQSGQGQQKVSITWLDAKNDAAQQEKDIDQLISQNIKAVVLQPVDAAAGARIVRKLAQAKIKVIVLETLPADVPVDGFITSDHDRTGELQARYLLSEAQDHEGALKTVILQGDKNDQVSNAVASAINKYLKGQYKVQVVLDKDHDRGDPQAAAATLEQYLAEKEGGVDAVVATDGRMAVAVTELLKNRGLNEKVITVGAGGDQKASQALAAGEHAAEVDVMPEMIAQYAYDAAVGLATTGYWQNDSKIKNGDYDVPAKITPVRLVTKSESYLLEQRWGQGQGQAQGGQQTSQQSGQQNSQQSGQDNQSGSQGKQQGEQSQGSGNGNAANSGGKKTTLKITTQDGKTVEVQINGEIKKIETIDGGAAGGKKGNAAAEQDQGGTDQNASEQGGSSSG